MSKGIFVHRPDSQYDDIPEARYQFPKRYLPRAREFSGDWIAYYEPKKHAGRMGYYAIAKVDRIEPDPRMPERFVAHIVAGSYLELDVFVPARGSEGYIESNLQQHDGGLNRGRVQWAVRPISDADFARLIKLGFPEEVDTLPRLDVSAQSPVSPGFHEAPEPYITFRESVEQIIRKIPRDRVFRRKVLRAYDNTCALTGLRLINGGGRAEVEAAHIRPVKDDGPDTPKNGIALSGTVHWMFDRGLVSLSDGMDILVSRQVNDPDRIWSLMNKDRKARVPTDISLRPHPRYLEWHRRNCFKG